MSSRRDRIDQPTNLVVECVHGHLVLEEYVHHNVLAIVTSNVEWSTTKQVDRVSLQRGGGVRDHIHGTRILKCYIHVLWSADLKFSYCKKL